MLEQLKSVFKLTGRGSAPQNLGELSPTADTISRIEKRCHAYHRTGGQGRIVLIASNDLMGAAFDFVVDLAKRTNSLIEVLYFRPEEETRIPIRTLLNKLGDLTHDFQITFVKGDLRKTLSNYHKQREDIMAVVSSSSELFLDDLRASRQTLTTIMRIDFPRILIVGHSFLA